MRQLLLGWLDLIGETEDRYQNETDVRGKVRIISLKLACNGKKKQTTSNLEAKPCGELFFEFAKYFNSPFWKEYSFAF